MNASEFKIELLRNNLTVPELAKMIGMDKATIYSRLSGDSEFKHNEICAVRDALHITDDRLLTIFFAYEVS